MTAVSKLSKFNNNPGKEHWSAVKRVFRYLKGTKATKLLYKNDNHDHFEHFSDSDLESDVDERRSVTGYVTIFQNGTVSWSTKHQPTLALSLTEAEYMALSAREHAKNKTTARETFSKSMHVYIISFAVNL